MLAGGVNIIVIISISYHGKKWGIKKHGFLPCLGKSLFIRVCGLR
jgi:hypothetical protein